MIGLESVVNELDEFSLFLMWYFYGGW